MNDIEAASGKNAKVALMKTADEITKKFLVYALDTYITFGVTLKKVPRRTKTATAYTHEKWWEDFDILLTALSRREITGNSAKSAISILFTCVPTDDDAKWGAKVLNKNLRCGTSQSSLLKAFPGIITPFAVSLAKPYDPDKTKLPAWGYVEPKLDGLRCVVIDGVAYTRNGRVIENAGTIIEELGDLTKDWVFDGELLDPNVSFEETISKARGSKGHDGLEYHVFDVVEREEWFCQDTKFFMDRRADLEDLLPDDLEHVKVVDTMRISTIPTAGMLMDYCDAYMEDGYEGAMFKAPDAPYCFKRSDAILKVKKFETHDAPVVEAQEGRGKYVGMLGALIVEGVGNVGSGFSDAERRDLWERRESLPGQIVEVKFQNKTAHGKDRFPTFIRFRPDKS